MRIAMISEHASPLATLGGEDAGGQNAHVAQLSAALAAAATRCGSTPGVTRPRCRSGPDAQRGRRGARARRPGAPLPKDELLPYMPAFGEWLRRALASGRVAPRGGPRALLDERAGRRRRRAATRRAVVQTYPRARRGQTPPPRRAGHQPAGADQLRTGPGVRRRSGDRPMPGRGRRAARSGVPRARVVVVPSGVD